MEMDSDVIIVGAGPVGLGTALELALRGIKVILIEQNDRGGMQPRAKTTNIRSMAHLRRWGIADRVRRASPLPSDYPTDVVFATRLFGHPLARFENAFFGDSTNHPDFPEAAQWIPQYTLERVLRERLAEFPNVTLRFSAKLESIAQDDISVAALITDTAAGTSYTLTASYLVGADGGRSTTRTLLGIQYEGTYAYMANFLAIYRAPGLMEAHPQKKAVSYWLVNTESPAVTGPMDRGDKWFFSTQLPKGVEPYAPELAIQKISQAIGKDVAIELLETDVWQAHKLIASTYSQGRIYLAGDSCHLHPPMGGYGMNQGLGDAVDLGWKLSAVLNKWAGEKLLDTYEAERKPVHQMFVDEATKNYGYVTHHMVNAQLERNDDEGVRARNELSERIVEGKRREFNAIGALLGYSYAPSGIVVSDGTPAAQHDPMHYSPTARPGALAPHHWLSEGVSIYDRFGPDYTLLQLGRESEKEAGVIMRNAASLGIPLTLVQIDDPKLAEIYEASLVLVRPDQHVAWRSHGLPADVAAVLLQICGRGSAPCIEANKAVNEGAA